LKPADFSKSGNIRDPKISILWRTPEDFFNPKITDNAEHSKHNSPFESKAGRQTKGETRIKTAAKARPPPQPDPDQKI
jgi:hypothetical protein